MSGRAAVDEAVIGSDNKLCRAIFSAAARGDRHKPTWVHGPDLETGGSQPWPHLDRRPGGFVPGHRTSLCIGNGEQFMTHRRLLLSEAFRVRMLFEDTAAWQYQRDQFHDVLGHFFGNSAARTQPALIWLAPWHVSGVRATPASEIDIHEARTWLGGREKAPRTLQLGFASAGSDLGITLHLRRLLMEFPEDRNEEGRYFWMRRQRSGRSRCGQPFQVTEEDLGLATPDDRKLLATGHYPASERYRVQVAGATYYRFRLLMLARFHPLQPGQAVVHHVIFPFNPGSAWTVDAGTYMRSFPVFLEHYPIRDLLQAALFRRSSHAES